MERIVYDVVEGDYGEFIKVLRRVLAEYEPAGDRQSVLDYQHAPHPVLPRQRSPRRPARWILITLRVRDEGHETTLAVRDDNVYLIGFSNRRGKWFEFGFGGGDGGCRSAQVLPADWSSTFLECDVGYGGMMVGGAMRLVGLGLGMCFARDAVRRLSSYEQEPGVQVDDRTKRHLARLIVMVCEAARMIPHCETVLDDWDRSSAAITERQVHLLWNWGRMSHAVLIWDWWSRHGSWNGIPPPWPPELLAPQVDVRNVGQALQIVQLLLNWSEAGPTALPSWQPPPPPQETAGEGDDSSDNLGRYWNGGATIPHVLGQQAGQCRLEIFGVRAGFYMRGAATISVFDGKRGQVIYSNNDDDKLDGDDDIAGRRRTMLGSLDHENGDCDSHHGRHFSEWRMFAQLRSFYNRAGVGFGGWWNRHSETKTIVTSKRENGSTTLVQFDQGHDLVLTGPYRAISAYGSVSVEIDSSTTTDSSNSYIELGISTAEIDYVRIDVSKKDTRRSSDDDGRTTTTLLWDCYNEEGDDVAYDTVLTRTISTSHGPVDVTYAVLSNAVEATVQVRLILLAGQGDGIILVHGRITAGYQDLRARSVLFCQDAEEKVAVVTGGDGSHVVPLSRSVVAVPLTSLLLSPHRGRPAHLGRFF